MRIYQGPEEIISGDERLAVGRIQRQLRILQGYAVVSGLVFCVLLFAALRQPEQKAKFNEIEVGRINVVEPDGKLRISISNNAQSPGLAMGGKYFSAREGTRGAGLIFYNDEGDENGGLAYSGKSVDGKGEADGLLAFDQYGQDQIVGILTVKRRREKSLDCKCGSGPIFLCCRWSKRWMPRRK